MRSPGRTDGRLASSLPWTVASLALALAPHVPYLPFWVTGAFFGCAAWRMLIEQRRQTLPPAWIRAALALLCFLGVLATYETISGVGPGSALLAVMASLKLLETRERRDQFVLLFIAIFLVMSALLREQFIWSLPYLLAALVFIMTAWLRMSADNAEPVRRSFATGARLVGLALPLAAAMWILFPRISSPFWAVPIDTSSGITGLDDTMSPGDISSLSQSDEVAFRVRFLGDTPPPRSRYWRMLVLHRFNGRSWSGRDPAIGKAADEQIEFFGPPLRYQITMEPTNRQWIPALEMPARWDLARTFMQPNQALARMVPVDQRLAFEAESHTGFRVQPDLKGLIRDWYLELPTGSNPRSATLAATMRAAAAGPRDYVDAVLRMFNEQQFHYSLQPPALGSNPVDGFLFRTREGFCEHYASAFAFLMRAAGIPARVVLGYQGGEINPLGEYMIVRQSDAHAWTEVWLEGAGWQRIDPTAAVAPERIDLGLTDSAFEGAGYAWGLSAPSRMLHRLRLSLDALSAAWNDRVLGYGPERQKRLLGKLGLEDPGWRKMLLALVAAVVLLTIAISTVLMWRYRPPPRDRARTLYDRFARRSGVERRTGETPGAFAERAAAAGRLDTATVREVTEAYLACRYGGEPAALARLERLVPLFSRGFGLRRS